PDSLSGLDVVRIDEAARAELGTRNSSQDQVLHDERCTGRAVALLVVGQRRFPDHRSGFGIQRDQGPLYGDAEEFVSMDRKSAIHFTATEIESRRRRFFVVPDGPARSYIERPGVIRRSG